MKRFGNRCVCPHEKSSRLSSVCGPRSEQLELRAIRLAGPDPEALSTMHANQIWKCGFIGIVFKSRCLRKPGRFIRWGSAKFDNTMSTRCLSNMIVNCGNRTNFGSFVSEIDHPPLFWGRGSQNGARNQTNFETKKYQLPDGFYKPIFLRHFHGYNCIRW